MNPVNQRDDVSIMEKKNAEFLWKIGQFLANSCPPASRFYLSNLEKELCEFPDLLKNKAKVGNAYCHFCGSLWNSSNCKIRMKPRAHANKHIKKLLKIEKAEPWKLNSQQKQKLKRYHKSTNKLVYKCLTCKKITSFAGTINESKILPEKSTIVKLNRSDVNAGLCIPSPCGESSRENYRSDLDTSHVSETNTTFNSDNGSFISSTDSPNNSNSIKNVQDSFKSATPSNSKVFPESTSKKKSSVKKRKSLLAEILDKEQNKKKKTSLSSFLVSL